MSVDKIRSKSPLDLAELLYGILIKIGDVLQPIILLVFRLTWGWQSFQTGQGKFTNHAKVAEFFASLGIPLPDLNAWFVGGVECFGGLFILVGLASRPASWLLFCSMTVAYLSVSDERAKVFGIFKDSTPFLTADPFFFWLTALLVLAFGPGQISLDYLIGKWLKKRNEK
jgi:putative oxidoreductase